MTRLTLALSALLIALAGGSAASPVTILEYQTGSSQSLSPSIEGVGITGSALTAGGGLTFEGGGTYNWSGWDPASDTAAKAVIPLPASLPIMAAGLGALAALRRRRG